MSKVLYTARVGQRVGAAMSYEEKRTWVYLLSSAAAYGVYLAIVVGRTRHAPVAQVSYVAPLLWTAGASIIASIVANVLVETVRTSDSRRGDVRDREISRFGEYASRWLVIAGAAAGLFMAMAGGITSGSPTSSISGSYCGRSPDP